MGLDPHRIDVRLLYTLETIQRTGSLTVAGEALGLSQPALSHQLRRMREIFKDPLFVRSATGMYATPKANELATSARRIQAVVKAEIGSVVPFHPQSLERVFNLCMSDVGEMVLLPKLIARLREEAPLVNVSTIKRSHREMVDALDRGIADLAIGAFSELHGAALKRQHLFDRGFLCLVSARHPRIQGERLSLATFLDEPHMIVSSAGSEEIFEQFLARERLTRRIAVTVPHMLCVPSVIAETDVIATVPQSVGLYFSNYVGVRVLPTPFEPPAEPPITRVLQYWSDRFDKDPAVVWLRRIVAELYQNSMPAPAGVSKI